MTGSTHNPWRSIWRALTSARLVTWLLAGLALFAVTGTLLPQLPTVVDESMRAAWFDLASLKYGSLYRSLGLCGVLFANTALCCVSPSRPSGRQSAAARPRWNPSSPTSPSLPYSGMLLPPVAVEQAWERDKFLAQVCAKAGLPARALLYRFSAQAFAQSDWHGPWHRTSDTTSVA